MTIVVRELKVLHVFKDYYPPTKGGVEQHINEIVHSLEGFDFAVLTSSRSRQRLIENDRGVRVIRAPELRRFTSTPITPSWRKLLRASGSDLFHFHMPNPFGELMYLAARSWTPMIATYHAEIIGRDALLPFFRPFQRRFLNKAQKIVLSNPRLLDTSPALTHYKDRAVVIPFGVDPDEWSQRPPLSDEIREKYNPPLIVFLGRLAHYKGVDVLIEAMERVDATLLIVGEGPKRRDYEEAASHLRIKRKVVFVGEIADADRAAYYHAADLFVLPAISRAEGFGIVMLQAMACGTPAISTELGTGTSWVNQDLKTGLVVKPGDAAGLAGAIKALLGDEVRRKEMGLAAAERAKEHFTKRKMLDSLSELYRSFDR